MDNNYPQCPPMMSDGRSFTNYQTATRFNEYVKYINGIVNNNAFRTFLQSNANTIMSNEREHLRKSRSCWVRPDVHVYPTRAIPRHFMEERQRFDKIFRLNKTCKPCSPNSYPHTNNCHKNQCPY